MAKQQPQRTVDDGDIGSVFAHLAEIELNDLPLYRLLCEFCATDDTVHEILRSATRGQQRPVLFLAAVHATLLEHCTPIAAPPSQSARQVINNESVEARTALAEWFPTCTEFPKDPVNTTRELRDAFKQFTSTHVEHLTAIVKNQTTQTNEVNRSAALYVGLLEVSRQLALAGEPTELGILDLGCSAGLNLFPDRYAYDFGPHGVLGNPQSEVRCETELRGHLNVCDSLREAEPLAIRWRRGIDHHPADLSRRSHRAWLQACVWPEQHARHHRFTEAARVARQALEESAVPLLIVGDAIANLEQCAQTAPRDVHITVMHSWMLTYVERHDRIKLDDAIMALSEQRDVSWLSFERPLCVSAIEPADNDALNRSGDQHARVL